MTTNLTEGECGMINAKIDSLKDKIDGLEKRIDKFDEKIENLGNKFVTTDRFKPVEMIAYAIVSLFGGGLAVAILALILKK